MAEEEQGGVEDVRMEVIQQYCLKTLKQKQDKWTKVNQLVAVRTKRIYLA